MPLGIIDGHFCSWTMVPHNSKTRCILKAIMLVSKMLTSFVLCMVLLMSTVQSSLASKNDKILCHMSMLRVMSSQERKIELQCNGAIVPKADEEVTLLSSSFLLDLPRDTVKANMDAIRKDNWFITFPSSWLSTDLQNSTMTIPPGEEVTTVDANSPEWRLVEQFASPEVEKSRELRTALGNETVLIVLISTQDAVPTKYNNYTEPWTPAVANDIVLGSSDSAATQFSACSFGQFGLVPFANNDTIIKEGDLPVINVTLDNITSDYDRWSVRKDRSWWKPFDQQVPAAQVKVCEAFSLPSNCTPALDLGIDHITYIAPWGLSSDSGTDRLCLCRN